MTLMHAKKILAAAYLILSAASATEAQTTQSIWDGVYTDAQADRGAGQYGQHCAVCHGKALEGNGEAPPLVGQFIPDWAGTTLDMLYEKVQATMPLNAPGTLRPTVAADILAYLLYGYLTKIGGMPLALTVIGAGTAAAGLLIAAYTRGRLFVRFHEH